MQARDAARQLLSSKKLHWHCAPPSDALTQTSSVVWPVDGQKWHAALPLMGFDAALQRCWSNGTHEHAAFSLVLLQRESDGHQAHVPAEAAGRQYGCFAMVEQAHGDVARAHVPVEAHQRQAAETAEHVGSSS